MNDFIESLHRQVDLSRLMISRYADRHLQTGYRTEDGAFMDTSAEDLRAWKRDLSVAEDLIRRLSPFALSIERI